VTAVTAARRILLAVSAVTVLAALLWAAAHVLPLAGAPAG
jgi:hypothetical protein